MIGRKSLDEMMDQLRADREHRDTNYTGVAYDAVTDDWMAWRLGEILGWAGTEVAAQALLSEAPRPYREPVA